MDYAFVPGATDYELFLRQVMKTRKTKTTLIEDGGVVSIADFLKALVDKNVTAGDLLMGAHASQRTFAMAFDTATPRPPGSIGRDYEMLEAVSAAGTIHIPNEVRTAATRCHIKGCNVGADEARPFLTLLKKALDNPAAVTAPRFLHVLKQDADRGFLEYMQYEFSVIAKESIKDTDALIEEFKKSPATQGVEVAGTPTAITENQWKSWVQPALNLKPDRYDEVLFGIDTYISPPQGKLKLIDRKNATCSSRVEPFTYPVPTAGRAIPPDKPGQIATMKPLLEASPTMQATHPFPIYVRMGFKDFASFFDGMSWDVTLQGPNLEFIGSHFVYTLEIPITKKGTKNLIFNYYPKSGSPTINFAEDNAAFLMFGTV
jgi:hypothetical protein